eukprot:GFUD01109207.1.p1 GENE.GFUD01109207.1~~GFUD01109207.1.p1  ORF type:complete len:244 (-),score=75.77 GFUD01109207.1:60-791(-)
MSNTANPLNPAESSIDSQELGNLTTGITSITTVTSAEEFLLTEDVDNQEETEDESDEVKLSHLSLCDKCFMQEEIAKFFMLMNKAEKKNQKRIASKQNHFGSKKTDWRSVTLGDPDEVTTDTEDEDDNQETSQFLSLMEKAKKKNTKVSIRWSNGQVKVEKVQEGIEGEISRREREKRAMEMKKEMMRRKERQARAEPQAGGKRKFEDRMSLNDAKLEDFEDTKDYVNFIQTKLQGVRIKIIK